MAIAIEMEMGVRRPRDVRASTRAVAPRALLWIALLSTESGCSFLFVRGPPDVPPPGKAIHCTSSKVAPVLDSIFATLEVVRVGLDAAVSDAAFQGAPFSRGTDIVLGAAFGVLFGASAAYGYAITDKCSRARHGELDSPEPPMETQKAVVPAAAPASPVSAAPAQGPKSFDQQAARAAIVAAIARADRKCHPAAVQGEASLTYEPDGHVSGIGIDPPMADRTVEDCVSNALLDASIPAYEGEPVVVKKSFHFGS